MKVIEVQSKNVEEAIREGCRQLGVSRDDVDIEVLAQGGIFRKAKVRLTAANLADDVAASPSATSSSKPPVAPTRPAASNDKKDNRKDNVIDNKREEKNVKPAHVGKDPHDTNQIVIAPYTVTEPTIKSNLSGSKASASKPTSTRPSSTVPTDKEKPREKSSSEAKENVISTATNSEASTHNHARSESSEYTSNAEKERNRPAEVARVLVDYVPSEELTAEKKAYDYLTTLLSHMGIEGKVSIRYDDGIMDILVDTQDSTIIGYRGEVLDSLENLISLAANQGDGKFKRINIDALGYRDKRAEVLVALAGKQADRAVRIGKKVILEPMGSNQRKVIHSSLADRTDIITRSEGREPNRRIVILPKK